MRSFKLYVTFVLPFILSCVTANSQDELSVTQLNVSTIVLTNKIDLTNLSSLGQPVGRFVTSDGAGGVQYSTFVLSNSGPWQFVPLTDTGLSITNPINGADMSLGADGSVAFGSKFGSIAAGDSFVFSGIATNTGFAIGGSANGSVSATIFGDAEGDQSLSLAGITTTNAPLSIAIGPTAVANAPGATTVSSSADGYMTNSVPYSMLLAFSGGVRVQGNGLAIATNISSAPISGYGMFWSSNYDLYWVTPTKTNLIVTGH